MVLIFVDIKTKNVQGCRLLPVAFIASMPDGADGATAMQPCSIFLPSVVLVLVLI